MFFFSLGGYFSPVVPDSSSNCMIGRLCIENIQCAYKLRDSFAIVQIFD